MAVVSRRSSAREAPLGSIVSQRRVQSAVDCLACETRRKPLLGTARSKRETSNNDNWDQAQTQERSKRCGEGVKTARPASSRDDAQGWQMYGRVAQPMETKSMGQAPSIGFAELRTGSVMPARFCMDGPEILE